MKISKRAENFIKAHEGLRLKAYYDAVGKLTIGWGHTDDAKYPVRPGMKITRAQAQAMFEHDIREAEVFLDRIVKVRLNGNQYGALISLIFNIGNGNFAKSTLLKRLNRGQKDLTREFAMWKKGKVNGRLVTLPGLVRRRAEEAALFMTPASLGDKVVRDPPIAGATKETQEGREAKGGVAEDRSGEPPLKTLFGGALAAILAPILQLYEDLKWAFGDYAPVATFLSIAAVTAIAYALYSYWKTGRNPVASEEEVV